VFLTGVNPPLHLLQVQNSSSFGGNILPSNKTGFALMYLNKITIITISNYNYTTASVMN